MHKLILSTLSLIALLMCLHHVFVFRILSWVLTFTLLFLSSAIYASSPPTNDVHICKIIDYEQWRRDHPRPAAKRLANLNVGEPRTVRMIYFLPNNRPFRQEVVDSMKVTIRQVQTFFADQMEAHGYGRKTFRFETDAQGEPVVHRVNGGHPENYYFDGGVHTYWDDIPQKFDFSANNVYLTVRDNGIGSVDPDAGGRGGGGRYGGQAWVAGEFRWIVVAHELGHAFGMTWHDWRDYDYIMSYGGSQRHSLSACAAEFLSVHPFFDPDIPDEETPSPTIELISPSVYPTGSTSVSIQLKVSDPDGLHQVILFNDPVSAGIGGGIGVKMCKGLNGETEAVVEFDYDGVIPSSYDPYGTGTSLSDPLIHPIYIRAIDIEGNVSNYEYFVFFNASLQRNIIATLEGHKDGVESIAFSPNGATLASGSFDGTVKLWDVATRTTITTLEGGSSIAFSPDGKILATSGWDIPLWDVATRTSIATLEHGELVMSVSFSPDGTTLASGSRDGTVKLWDIATKTNIATLEGHGEPVRSVSFSPDGTTLASESLDATIRLWDVATGTNIATLEGHRYGVNSVSFSPDGTLLASGATDGTVKLWDIATKTNIATLEHGELVNSVSFSSDGTTLASGSFYGAVKLWDVATKKNIATFWGHNGSVKSVSFSPDGSMLASASLDSTVKLWDTSEYLRPRPVKLAKISGDNQQGTPSTELTSPLVVELRDQYGATLQGVQVTFTVTAGNGRLNGEFSIESTTTDASGRAQSTLTLGPNPGTTTVEVSIADLEPVTFNAVGVSITPITGGDYQKWHLPDGAISRLGKGRISESDRAIAFSPDGQRLAVASGIGIWLYEMATKRPHALLPTARLVHSVVFSPDGMILASGLDNGRVELWEVETGTMIATFEGHIHARVTSLAFSPDGTLLASGSWDQIIKLWNLEKREEVGAWKVERNDNRVYTISVSFSPDGTTLASGFQDGTVRLWDIATQKQIATLEEHTDYVTSVSFSPNGTTLASGSRDATIRLWDVATGTNIATLEGRRYGVNSVSFSPDGTLLAYGSEEVKLWDISTRRTIATLGEHTDGVNAVSFSPDGTLLASAGSRDGTVKLWDVETGNATTLFGDKKLFSMAFSPDGTLLASAGSRDGTVKLWDVGTGQTIATLRHTYWVGAMSFSPDGTTLASTGYGIELWDVSTRRTIATLEQHTNWSETVSFSPDGTLLASGSFYDGTVKLWDVATRIDIATLGPTGGVNAISFSPDGATLAAGVGRVRRGENGTVILWDVATQRNIATLEVYGAVLSTSFSPDGTILASGSWEGRIELWDVVTHAHIATLGEHLRDHISSMSFSPDGTILASTEYARVKLWDVSTRRNVANLDGHGSRVNSVVFSPDGTILASGSEDGTILIWDMSKYVTPSTPTSDPTSDFNGDGTVGISDFLQFVEQFGFSQGDAGYEARFDLDGDGVIGIGDFLIFVNSFGTEGS